LESRDIFPTMLDSLQKSHIDISSKVLLLIVFKRTQRQPFRQRALVVLKWYNLGHSLFAV